MEYRHLGNSGLQVSVVGLGCNNFGRRCDQKQTTAVVNRALDLGITFLDTADVYGPGGQSEEYMAETVRARRREMVLATKFAAPMGEGPHWSGASRRYIIDAVDASLRRLGTDYVDLYQVHFPDAATPIDETLRALDDLVRSGKVRYIGCSNFSGWQIADAAWTSRAEHLTPFISAQNQYSLVERDVERDVVPACRKFGLGVIPYFPLAGGLLTGKYRRGEPAPEGTRLSAPGPMTGRFLSDRYFDILEKLEAIARDAGRSMVELSVSWLANQPAVSSVIAGATRPEQVEQNAKAADWTMTAEELAAIDAATRG